MTSWPYFQKTLGALRRRWIPFAACAFKSKHIALMPKLTWLTVAFLVVADPASAASQLDWSNCTAADPHRKIAGCTRILQDRGEIAKSRAIAYYNRGLAHYAKGDIDRAIADYNEALRLDPNYASAFENRGWAWIHKGNLDRSIADYNEAIRLDPKLSVAYSGRGIVWYAAGDLDRAIADYNEAIRLDPKFVLAHINRGVAFLYGGSIARAQADFLQASMLNRKDAYAALWLEIAARRGIIPSQLPQAAKQLDMKAWPAPLVRLFLGEITSADAIAAADNADPNTKRERLCEANFFSGVLALLQNAKEDALPLLHIAANDCPRTFIEWEAANAELNVLVYSRE